jgi:hypothetical protein
MICFVDDPRYLGHAVIVTRIVYQQKQYHGD